MSKTYSQYPSYEEEISKVSFSKSRKRDRRKYDTYHTSKQMKPRKRQKNKISIYDDFSA